MHAIIDKEISLAAWNDLIMLSSCSSPFQTPEFHAFFNSLPGFSAVAVGIEDGGRLLALVVATIQKEKGVKGYFSRRAIIYGGPVLLNDTFHTLPVLIKELNRLLKGKVIYTETRNFNDYGFCKDVFAEQGWSYQPYLNFHLACTSYEVTWNQLNNNRKRQISKALKSGVTIKEAASTEEVKAFYDILKTLYGSRIKKPLPSYRFFETFYKSAIGKYFLVHYQDKIIGGIMCPTLKGKAIYEFYICGLDQEYKEASPSVMATWAAIEYGYKTGFQNFDFMGAGKPDENYGVREFKEKFGGELVEHGRFIKINNKFLYKLGVAALSLLKWLKK